MEEWLSSDEHNVVGIHCRAGKGRTRTFVCSYLVYSRVCGSADEAIDLFNHRRIHSPQGDRFPVVVIPSQRRYISYVGSLMRLHNGSLPPQQQQRTVRSVQVLGFEEVFYDDLVMEIVQEGQVVFQSLPRSFNTQAHVTSLGDAVVVSGDVLFRFQSPLLEGDWEGCSFFFHLHTAFIEGNKFEGGREDVGNAFRWKNRDVYTESFKVIVIFDDAV